MKNYALFGEDPNQMRNPEVTTNPFGMNRPISTNDSLFVFEQVKSNQILSVENSVFGQTRE